MAELKEKQGKDRYCLGDSHEVWLVTAMPPCNRVLSVTGLVHLATQDRLLIRIRGCALHNRKTAGGASHTPQHRHEDSAHCTPLNPAAGGQGLRDGKRRRRRRVWQAQWRSGDRGTEKWKKGDDDRMKINRNPAVGSHCETRRYFLDRSLKMSGGPLQCFFRCERHLL